MNSTLDFQKKKNETVTILTDSYRKAINNFTIIVHFLLSSRSPCTSLDIIYLTKFNSILNIFYFVPSLVSRKDIASVLHTMGQVPQKSKASTD